MTLGSFEPQSIRIAHAHHPTSNTSTRCAPSEHTHDTRSRIERESRGHRKCFVPSPVVAWSEPDPQIGVQRVHAGECSARSGIGVRNSVRDTVGDVGGFGVWGAGYPMCEVRVARSVLAAGVLRFVPVPCARSRGRDVCSRSSAGGAWLRHGGRDGTAPIRG
jgi:hypothetical protein